MRAIVLIITMGILLNSCSENNDNINPQPVQIQVSFDLVHSIGSQLLEFDTINYTNEFGNNYSVATLKYFVSDFTFHKADGSEFKIDEEHYVDGRELSTTTFFPSTKVPVGDYSSLSFIFGIDSTKNKIGLFHDPPESLMEWPAPMGGGYHYMKLEGKFNQNDTIKNYQCHTGPTMGNPNFIQVTLADSEFSTGTTNKTITLKMDINKWFENPNTLDLNDVTGIMGNQPMQLKLKDNGADVFSLVWIVE